MRRLRWRRCCAILAAAPAHAGHADLNAEAQARAASEAEFALAGACSTLQPQTTTLKVAALRRGYDAAAVLPEEAEVFRMQATDLGSYLMLGSDGDFLSTDGGQVVPAEKATPAGDWRVHYVGTGYTVTSGATGKALALDDDGKLVLVNPVHALPFEFAAAEGCIPFPEAELNLVGDPQKGATPYGETRGLVDAHMHMFAFESFGGNLHCGRPWSPLGIDDAPSRTAPTTARTARAPWSRTSPPTATRPTCTTPRAGRRSWTGPSNESYTHENVYYRWLERTYRSGLRLVVNLAVDNSALCFVNPHKIYSCDEMEAVDRQIRDIYELQDYVDAQYGGPGKGWFRIVRNPFQARRVINEGKLAVVMGIEVSEPFGCGLRNDEPQCTTKSIDADFEKYYKRGVRQMEMVNKFDNALSGVAFDNDEQGVIVNVGNRQATGRFWQMEKCTSKPYDRQPTPVPAGSAFEAIIRQLIPSGALPVYPEGPVCNPRGLTDLGEHFLDDMIERGMLFDPDHMSVRARRQALNYARRPQLPGHRLEPQLVRRSRATSASTGSAASSRR